MERAVNEPPVDIISPYPYQAHPQGVGKERHYYGSEDEKGALPVLLKHDDGKGNADRKYGDEKPEPAAFLRHFQRHARHLDKLLRMENRHSGHGYDPAAKPRRKYLEREADLFHEKVEHRHHEKKIADGKGEDPQPSGAGQKEDQTGHYGNHGKKLADHNIRGRA